MGLIVVKIVILKNLIFLRMSHLDFKPDLNSLSMFDSKIVPKTAILLNCIIISYLNTSIRDIIE